MREDPQKIVTSQIGAIMYALTTIIRYLERDPHFHADIRDNLNHYLQVLQGLPYSDEEIELARGTVAALLREENPESHKDKG
jgi:hypothetical protein